MLPILCNLIIASADYCRMDAVSSIVGLVLAQSDQFDAVKRQVNVDGQATDCFVLTDEHRDFLLSTAEQAFEANAIGDAVITDLSFYRPMEQFSADNVLLTTMIDSTYGSADHDGIMLTDCRFHVYLPANHGQVDNGGLGNVQD
jgi:hypothetical protein